jgi:anti-sigma factor RsiW
MNMNTSTHPIEHEEVMAQLEGELPQDRAAVVAAHMVSCDECRQLAADLTNVSQRLQGWQVEIPEPGSLFLLLQSSGKRRRRQKDTGLTAT